MYRKPPKGYRYYHGKLVTFAEYNQQSRAEIKETIEKLNAEINHVFETDTFREYLDFAAKIPRYSFRNQVLLMMQHKEPTIFMGYVNWQKLGRHVIKGGKGCKILAPSLRRSKPKPEKETKEENLLPESEESAEEKEAAREEESTYIQFVETTVFPLDQTEGKPLPHISTDLNSDISNYDEFRKALVAAAPCPVYFDEEPRKHGAYAFYNREKEEIHCRIDMSQMDICASLIHEMAHATLHAKGKKIEKEGTMTDTQVKEVEAEATAYSVSRYFGMDTALCSAPYIAMYNGKDLTEKMTILSHIQDATRALVDAIEPELMRLLSEKRQRELFLQEKELFHSLGTTLKSVRDAQESRFLFSKEDCAAVYINTQSRETTPQDKYYKFDSYDFLEEHGIRPEKSQHEFMKYIALDTKAKYESGKPLSREGICDKIFGAFQGGAPSDGAFGPYDYENKEHYSISIGDVIGINLKGEISFHYCDSFGWKRLEGFYQLEDNPICTKQKAAYAIADRILTANEMEEGTFRGSIYSDGYDLLGECEYPAGKSAGEVINDLVASITIPHDLPDGDGGRLPPSVRGSAEEGDPVILLSYEDVRAKVLEKEEEKAIASSSRQTEIPDGNRKPAKALQA